MRNLKYSVLSLSLFLVLPLTAWSNITIKVTSVHDGDTLTAVGVHDRQKYKIRLLGVDTPEKLFNNKTQGIIAERARSYLLALLPEDGVIEISDDSENDKHGRVLARLIFNGQDLNKEILAAGWGVTYFIYPFDKRHLSNYSEVLQTAIEEGRGMFSEEFIADFEEPYQFRMRVQNFLGTNLIGNIQTKKLYRALEIDQVPVFLRAFFNGEEAAQINGYSF